MASDKGEDHVNFTVGDDNENDDLRAGTNDSGGDGAVNECSHEEDARDRVSSLSRNTSASSVEESTPKLK